MRCALRRSAFQPPHRTVFSRGFADAYAALAAGDVAPDLAREIVEGAETRLGVARLSLPNVPA